MVGPVSPEGGSTSHEKTVDPSRASAVLRSSSSSHPREVAPDRPKAPESEPKAHYSPAMDRAHRVAHADDARAAEVVEDAEDGASSVDAREESAVELPIPVGLPNEIGDAHDPDSRRNHLPRAIEGPEDPEVPAGDHRRVDARPDRVEGEARVSGPLRVHVAE